MIMSKNQSFDKCGRLFKLRISIFQTEVQVCQDEKCVWQKYVVLMHIFIFSSYNALGILLLSQFTEFSNTFTI